MTTETQVPPLGSKALRVWDARVAGGLLAVIGVVSGAVEVAGATGGGAVAELGLLPPLVIGASLVVGARRVPSWLLSVLSAVIAPLASLTSVEHAAHGAGAGGADASATLVLIVLQMCAFRSRREAWLQFGWAVSVFGVALALRFGVAASVSSWVIATAVLAVLTGAGTWTRRNFDDLLSQLHHQADHDPLSGLLNRDGLLRQTARDLSSRRHRAAEVDVTVLLLDIDHFKTINDTWGHPAGDEVLIWLSGLLRASVRPPESAARFGGEEFLLVLPGNDLALAYDRAERLRQLVASASAPLRHPVTVSIGVACGTVPTDGGDLHDLYARADQALYRAKEAGRNRVEVAVDVPAVLSTDDPTPDRRGRPR